MTVMAAEAAPAAEGAAGGSSAAAGAGAAGAGGGHGNPAGKATGEAAKGVLLAIAIVLLWLAGLAFFIALEGSQLLGEQAAPTGGGFMKGLIGGLNRVVTRQAATSGATTAAGG